LTAGDFEIQRSKLAGDSAWLELWTLDCTGIGGGIIYWTPGPLAGSPVVMDGITYAPLPIQGSGFEMNGQGPLPTPTLKVANVSNIPMALAISLGDLLGAIVTRVRTYQKYLDGQSQADPTQVSGQDVFRVERKAEANKNFIQWELAAFTDVQGRQVPYRVILQGACTQTYRVWDPTTNSFIQGTCPWTGTPYYDQTGTEQENPALDNCSRLLSTGCVLRFGATTPLPTWQFPGCSVNGS
jgi:lambda family phage minor tail protein L